MVVEHRPRRAAHCRVEQGGHQATLHHVIAAGGEAVRRGRVPLDRRTGTVEVQDTTDGRLLDNTGVLG